MTASRCRPHLAPTASYAASRCRRASAGSRPSWIVFALTNDTDEQIERLARRAALPARRFGRRLARPWRHAHQRRSPRAKGIAPEREDTRRCGRLPHHPRSRRDHHLRRGAAHTEPAAALSVGSRVLQGQADEPDAVSRHRHRHFRPARAVPHHRFRGQGRRHFPGRCGAGVGGPRLRVHRLRLLDKTVRL